MARATTQTQHIQPAEFRSELHQRVAEVLELIRPSIQSDGGDIQLVAVEPSGRVRIRFQGACLGCPSSTMTLKFGIEENLRRHVAGVTEVVAENG